MSKNKDKTNYTASFIKTGDELKIVYNSLKTDPSLINSIRRTLMAEIVCFSLNANPKIYSNTSNVFKNNELIINRVSQIPILIKDINDTSFVDQKIVFYICSPGDITKPLINNDDHDLHVSANMFQIFDKIDNTPSKIKISDIIKYDLPILKLRKGEEFHFSIEISSGVGYYNATWKGCRVRYKFENNISLATPTEKKKMPVSPITGLPLETIADKKDYPKNTLNNPEFISLAIRSNGHYEPEVCYKLALDTLENKLLTLKHMVENPMLKNNNTKVDVIRNVNIENFIHIKITDITNSTEFLATKTIGELIRKHMFYELTEKLDEITLRECLVACRQPHPLDRVIYIDIKTTAELFKKTVNDPPLQLFYDTIDNIINIITNLKNF